jgi:hypothetical protein
MTRSFAAWLQTPSMPWIMLSRPVAGHLSMLRFERVIPRKADPMRAANSGGVYRASALQPAGRSVPRFADAAARFCAKLAAVSTPACAPCVGMGFGVVR